MAPPLCAPKLRLLLALLWLVAATSGAQLRRVWMQDHCVGGICTGIEIGRDDYVIMSQTPIAKQLTLSFANSSIAKIPHLMFDTFPDLQELRMEHCALQNFERPQFEGASNLMTLHLGHNQLRDIPKNIFLGADNLRSLRLDYNALHTLHNASFQALKELRQLSLEGNSIELLPVGVFAPLRQLHELNLAGNRLQSFHRATFERNAQLARINLARNQLKAFESSLFPTQPQLELLDLSGNELPQLALNFTLLGTLALNDCDLRALDVHGIVGELELRNNSLRALPELPHAVNLTSLDVSLNPLGSLLGQPFKRFTQLQRLNLSTTQLHELPEGVLKRQAQLQLLDISGNSLVNLRSLLFDSLKALQYFYFQQNNWNCDFLQLLMKSYVKQRDIAYMEDLVAPELVDDYVDGIACWYDTDRNSKRCDAAGQDAAMELSIVRNDIKSFTESVERKFVRLYRLLEELKARM